MDDQDYENLTLARMAIVERDDRLVILLPPRSTPREADDFADRIESLGWPRERIMVLCGPEAFAVLKGKGSSRDDEAQGEGQQPQGDQADPAEAGDSEGSDPEAHGSDDPEEQVPGDSHTHHGTQSGYCVHGVPWDGMSYTHFAMNHKIDHP